MINYNGNKIKDIVYNGAYIQTVIQNGNVLYSRSPSNGAYIQTVNGRLYTRQNYKQLFANTQTITKNGLSITAVNEVDPTLITNIERTYSSSSQQYSWKIYFKDAATRMLFTIAKVIFDGGSSNSGMISMSEYSTTTSDLETALNYNYSAAAGGGSNPESYILIPKTRIPNGIAVISDDYQFVMALSDSSSYLSWGEPGVLVNNIVTTTDANIAKADYLGSNNTDKIIAQLGPGTVYNNCPAATYCKDYTFPNGQKGYLGSLGEWQEAGKFKTEIDTCLRMVGNAMNTKIYYWASTQWDGSNSWVLFWNNSSNYHHNKNVADCVRAFTTL